MVWTSPVSTTRVLLTTLDTSTSESSPSGEYRYFIDFFSNSEMEVDLSTLAAKSALHSTKRARILYDVNPHTAFLPSADPVITASSIARRRRRLPPTAVAHHGGAKSSTALTVMTDSTKGVLPDGRQAAPNTSTALIRTGDDSNQGSEEPKAGGILVVRGVANNFCLLGIAGTRASRIAVNQYTPFDALLCSQHFCVLVWFLCFRNPNRVPAIKSRSQLQHGMHHGNLPLCFLHIWDGFEALPWIQPMTCLLPDLRIEQSNYGIWPRRVWVPRMP